jgi:hypothetical protein
MKRRSCFRLTFIKNKETSKIQKYFVIKKIKKFNFWTKEEDDKLLQLCEQSKYKNWKEISKNIPNKSPMQCSARYLKIKPGIKKEDIGWKRKIV